jgi:hypothetical protein
MTITPSVSIFGRYSNGTPVVKILNSSWEYELDYPKPGDRSFVFYVEHCRNMMVYAYYEPFCKISGAFKETQFQNLNRKKQRLYQAESFLLYYQCLEGVYQPRRLYSKSVGAYAFMREVVNNWATFAWEQCEEFPLLAQYFNGKLPH